MFSVLLGTLQLPSPRQKHRKFSRFANSCHMLWGAGTHATGARSEGTSIDIVEQMMYFYWSKYIKSRNTVVLDIVWLYLYTCTQACVRWLVGFFMFEAGVLECFRSCFVFVEGMIGLTMLSFLLSFSCRQATPSHMTKCSCKCFDGLQSTSQA